MKDASRYVFTCLILFAAAAYADTEILVRNGIPVVGLQQSDYANMWWQWAVSMPATQSPVRDRVGDKCGVNQVGPVWFLAGGYGSSHIKRTCTIPSDKYVFFPIINMIYYPREGRRAPSCQSVKAGAALNNQYLRSFKIIIDKQQYLNPALYRQASKKCFDLIARKPNITESQHVYPSATDGYWIMLKPLSVGRHHIAFRAEYDRPRGSRGNFGKMVQDIEYDIKVNEP